MKHNFDDLYNFVQILLFNNKYNFSGLNGDRYQNLDLFVI